MIKIDSSQDVLLIDLSYFYIYRYYALTAWFKISETPYDEELFIEKYKKLFMTNLNKLVKKFKVKVNNVVLAGDCYRKTIWRCEIFAKYKENRDKLADKENSINPKIINMIYTDIIPSLIEKGYQFVCIDKLEADDIIFCITKKIENKITILTNDNDYLQMIKENIDIVNLPSFKSIKNRGTGCPKKDLKMKILCGDPSDNIPGLMGKKQAQRIIDDDDKIDQYILNNDLKKKYELNTKLIDMLLIPDELKEKVIIEKYNDS